MHPRGHGKAVKTEKVGGGERFFKKGGGWARGVMAEGVGKAHLHFASLVKNKYSRDGVRAE